LVAGGGNLARFKGAEDRGLVYASRIGGLLQTVSHAVGSVALIRASNDASRLVNLRLKRVGGGGGVSTSEPSATVSGNGSPQSARPRSERRTRSHASAEEQTRLYDERPKHRHLGALQRRLDGYYDAHGRSLGTSNGGVLA